MQIRQEKNYLKTSVNTALVRVDNDYIKEGHFDCPESIQVISACAFDGCTNLRTITLPSRLIEIGTFAFRDCTNLTSIILPPMTRIGIGAFENCTNLITIILPPGPTWIASSTFENCTKLTTIILPPGLSEIGEDAFTNCINLTSIILSPGLTNIGTDAFKNCPNLKHLIIDSEEDSEINELRTLLPEHFQNKVVKKSSCIYWAYNVKEVFNNNGVPQDVSNLINDLILSHGISFFNTNNTAEQLQSLALTEKDVDYSESSNYKTNTF